MSLVRAPLRNRVARISQSTQTSCPRYASQIGHCPCSLFTLPSTQFEFRRFRGRNSQKRIVVKPVAVGVRKWQRQGRTPRPSTDVPLDRNFFAPRRRRMVGEVHVPDSVCAQRPRSRRIDAGFRSDQHHQDAPVDVNLVAEVLVCVVAAIDVGSILPVMMLRRTVSPKAGSTPFFRQVPMEVADLDGRGIADASYSGGPRLAGSR